MKHAHRSERRLSPILALALAVLVAACSEGPSAPGDTLARARASGTLRIGYANEAPYAYLDPSTGELTGEAPAIARAVLAELGIGTIEGVLTEFGSLIPGLEAGRFDVIAAGMYILPVRCRRIAFSSPTYSVGEAFLVEAGNPNNLHSYADVANGNEMKLGVVAGAVQLQYAVASGVPRSRIVVFPDAPSALEGVLAQRVDAYAATALTVNDLLQRAGHAQKAADKASLERAEPFADPVIDGRPVRGYGAFGFRKDDPALLRAFNDALAKLIGTPRHLELVRPFGFTAQEQPGSANVEALCRE